MFGVKATAKNLDQWTMDGSRFGAELTPKAINKALKEIKKTFYKYNKEMFSNQGADNKAGQWAELTPEYRAWKNKHYPGRPIMVLTGELQKSLIGKGNNSIAYPVIKPKSSKIKLGTNIIYAEYHQKGIRSGRKRKLKRKTIDPSDKQMAVYLKAIQRQIVEHARNRHGTFIDEWKSLGPSPTWDKKDV